MRRLPSFWKCLDDRADTAAPLARWRLAAGADFDVVERFLVAAGATVSRVYPCPDCERDLLVVPVGDAFVAEPDAGAPCRPLDELASEDLREFGLNWAAIVRSLVAATGCPFELEGVNGGGVSARGDWVRDFRRVPVAVGFGANDRVWGEEAVRLSTAREGALLLTARHNRKCECVLAGTRCEYVALEDVIGADEDGRLVCTCDLTTRLTPAAGCQEGGPGMARKTEWVFLDEGASYRVVMPEGEFTMPKRAGEMYLHWFARNPRKDCRALALVVQVRGMGGRKTNADWDEQDAAVSVGRGQGEDVNSVTSRQTLQELRERLRAIKTDRDRAENDGDRDRVAQLDEEVDAIEQQMAKDTNRFGKIRKTADDDTKAAKSITRELDRAYERLREAKGERPARSAFVEHFKRHVSLGYECRYDPAMERDWRVAGK